MNLDYLDLCCHVAQVIHEVCNDEPNFKFLNPKGYFVGGPNFFYRKFGGKFIKDGIILEMYYGSPNRLKTYFGDWNIGGSSYTNGQDNIMEKIKGRLGLELVKEGYQNSMGYFGPWWKVTKIVKSDGKVIDVPNLELSDDDYGPQSYDEGKEIFNELKKSQLYQETLDFM